MDQMDFKIDQKELKMYEKLQKMEFLGCKVPAF